MAYGITLVVPAKDVMLIPKRIMLPSLYGHSCSLSALLILQLRKVFLFIFDLRFANTQPLVYICGKRIGTWFSN